MTKEQLDNFIPFNKNNILRLTRRQNIPICETNTLKQWKMNYMCYQNNL